MISHFHIDQSDVVDKTFPCLTMASQVPTDQHERYTPGVPLDSAHVDLLAHCLATTQFI